MGSVYKAIIERANEIKARKQADYQALVRRTYSGDEKITSQISQSDHYSQIDDPQSLGILNTADSLRTLTTERAALLSAGGIIAVDENPPVVDKPNRYANLKRCMDDFHEGYMYYQGDRYVHRSEFGHDPRHSDGLKSICKTCEARRRREAYVPRWRKGT